MLIISITKITQSKMKQRIRLTESQLHNVIRKCINEALNDYEGNDLDYQSISDQAFSVITRMMESGMSISWRNVARQMGFRLETLNGEDMELLKDAIEDAMYEIDNED